MQHQPQIRQRVLQVNRAFCHCNHCIDQVRSLVRGEVRGVVRDGGPHPALRKLAPGIRAAALFSAACTVGLRALGLTTPAQAAENSPTSKPTLTPTPKRRGKTRAKTFGLAASARQIRLSKTPR
jgi:hypothetical protein